MITFDGGGQEEHVSGLYTASPAGDERWRATWVPVDQRLFGMERRTLLPAGLVVLLFAVAVWILPAISDKVSVDDPIRAGDVIEINHGVQFVPIAGANLVSGLRQGQAGAAGYPDYAVISYGGVAFEVKADTYRGTPAQLLAQIEKNNEGTPVKEDQAFHVTSDPVTITNSTGQHGVAAHFDGTHAVGLLGAFVFGETGVEIEVVGPPTVATSIPAEVAAMIQSVRPTEGSGS